MTYSTLTTKDATVDDGLKFYDTLFHCRGNGTNGSTTFTDISPNEISLVASGHAQVSTAVTKFGNGSLYVDGYTVADGYSCVEGDNGAAQIYVGNSDYCMETWFYLNSWGAFLMGAGLDRDGQGTVLHVDAGGTHQLCTTYHIGTTGSGYSLFEWSIASSIGVTLNTWHHAAVVRDGEMGVMRVFLDGVPGSYYSIGTNEIHMFGGRLWLGACPFGRISTTMNGYLEEMRITVGSPMYRGPFTPPAAPFSGKQAYPADGVTGEVRDGTIGMYVCDSPSYKRWTRLNVIR
jgi:hypothetical protein